MRRASGYSQEFQKNSLVRERNVHARTCIAKKIHTLNMDKAR